MPLTPGTRLGVYEIAVHIGEGGMGAVYRATDTNLSRQVAIKVLPDAFAQDAERLARFEREAKTLASLNHPNIAAIYGFEKSGGAHALVMELVEGDDLSQRIARGAISVDEALPIARQIAEALEAAHEQGIIHRDLKPANIKVRPDGTVKVLDFGLAKAMEPAAGSSPSLSMSPTITTPAMTQAGMILGTAAYMSPEQARGKTVDRRADMWAFGAVLFEMLTGTRAFEGEDIADTLGNVMKVEPNWQRLPASIPPRVVQVVRACLQKNPRQRMDSAQGVRLALDGAFETAAPQATSAASSASPARLGWIGAFAVAAVLAAALAVPATRYLRAAPPSALPEARVEIVTPTTDSPTSFALSPDGRTIVFVASGDGVSRLWLRSMATSTAQSFAGTEGATFPFWSPDSRSIAFFADGKLKRLDIGIGVPQTLTPATNGSGGTWTQDGDIVFAPSQTGILMRVSATGGPAVPLTTLGPRQSGHRWPQMLPDGRRVLFFVQGSLDAAGIYLGSIDGGTPTRLTLADSGGVYLPSGWLLWVRAGTLVAQRLDAAHSALTGESMVLADGVTIDTNSRQSAVSVAATGLVAYRIGGTGRRQLTWVDRLGRARGTVGVPDATLSQPRVSPDGRRVVVTRTVQSNEDLWLLDGARASRFTFDSAQDTFPVWSPDGTRIVFRSRRTGLGDLYQKLSSGAGTEDRLVASDLLKSASSWSADGRFLLYTNSDPHTNTDTWVVPMAGDHTPAVVLKTPFRENGAAFSPDGRWLAYQSNESGRNEIYVRRFVLPGATGTSAATSGGQWQVSTAGGISPTWRADGKEIYYLNPAAAMMAAPITVTGSALDPGSPVTLFPTRVYGGGEDIQYGRQFDVTSDGRFLVNTVLDEAAAPITLLMNWNPAAKR